jgi:hypothetical protein
MVGSSGLFDVDMHHNSGVMPVRPSGRVSVPTRLDQTQKRIDRVRQRQHWINCVAAVAVIVLPLRDQRIPV